jgi:hypothetical protein
MTSLFRTWPGAGPGNRAARALAAGTDGGALLTALDVATREKAPYQGKCGE